MDHSHSPALDRLIRRQRVSDPSLPVSDSSSPAPAGGADSSTSTSAAPTSTTTSSSAPVASTTTTSSIVATTSSTVQSSVVQSSSTSSTTTTPVQVTSETSASSSSTTTTTTPAAATSSSTTSTSSTTLRQVTSAEEAETATSTSARTTVVIVSGSASSTSASSASLASSTAGSSSDSSIGTGGVIGIVAGAVVGVVFVAALIAFLFKKYSRKDDDDQISPFDKDEFRRASVMLDDDDQHYAHSLNSYRGGGGGGGMGHQGQGHSPQMSEYSMSNVGVGAILPGLARGNTLQSPRPPTQLMNHYQQQQMMPSFQPGQVVLPNSPNSNNGNPYAQQFPNNGSPPLGQYAPMDPYANQQYNGMLPQHPQPVHQQYAVDQSGLSAGQWNGGGGGGMMGAPQNLSRANSQVSSYSQFSDSGSGQQHAQQSRSILPPALRSGGGGGPSSHGHPDERPLSQVQEDDESFEYVQERSGTPTNSNVQQTFFGREGVSAERGEWNEGEGEEERRRRLSIRNGGLDRDDPYDGIN